MRLSFLAAGIAVALFMSGGAKTEGIMSGPCIGCAEGIYNVRAASAPVCPAPTVTAVSPNTGSTAGGTSVTITGTNFTGATNVNFGLGNAATFSVTNPTTIAVASSPAGSAGVVDVMVTTSCGVSAISAADQYTYVAPSYQGPGDIIAAWLTWASSARAYNKAYANGTNPAADLVAVTGGAAVCTLRVATTGFVDLTAYCPGSLTPAAACAAASGGSCVITKIYDQTGNGNHFTQATLANMPSIAFSALNGLPAVNCGPDNTTVKFLQTGSITQAQPMLLSTVGEATTSGQGAFVGSGSVQLFLGQILVNTAIATSDNVSTMNASATTNSFHSLQGYLNGNGTSSALNVDGADTPGAGGTSGLSAANLRFCRGDSGVQAAGTMMEGGVVAGTFTATQRNNISANQHGANGYNF